MTTAPCEILGIAQALCSADNEAGFRSAVSRAYYALYHGCLEWEADLPVPGSADGAPGGVHQQLINRLRNPPPELKDPTARSLSRRVAAIVEGLRTKRTAADYRLQLSCDAEAAHNACALVEETLNRIGSRSKVDDSAIESAGGTTATASEDCTAVTEPEQTPPPSPPTGGPPKLRRVH